MYASLERHILLTKVSIHIGQNLVKYVFGLRRQTLEPRQVAITRPFPGRCSNVYDTTTISNMLTVI